MLQKKTAVTCMGLRCRRNVISPKIRFGICFCLSSNIIRRCVKETGKDKETTEHTNKHHRFSTQSRGRDYLYAGSDGVWARQSNSDYDETAGNPLKHSATVTTRIFHLTFSKSAHVYVGPLCFSE